MLFRYTQEENNLSAFFNLCSVCESIFYKKTVSFAQKTTFCNVFQPLLSLRECRRLSQVGHKDLGTGRLSEAAAESWYLFQIIGNIIHFFQIIGNIIQLFFLQIIGNIIQLFQIIGNIIQLFSNHCQYYSTFFISLEILFNFFSNHWQYYSLFPNNWHYYSTFFL